jgi:hypothetical protein
MEIEYKNELLLPIYHRRPHADEKMINILIEEIEKAKTPVILV